MRYFAALMAIFSLSACVVVQRDPPPLAPLAENRAQPGPALIEQVLREHFAGQGSGAGPTTTCVSLAPRALTPAEEQALIAQFVRLAPASRCQSSPGGPVNSIVGTRAEVIQVYEFACMDADRCVGWVVRQGQPATRYAMRWQDRRWTFTSDRRLIAE